MYCINPYCAYLTGYKTKNGKDEFFIDLQRKTLNFSRMYLDKSQRRAFCSDKVHLDPVFGFYVDQPIMLPCGHCKGCLIDRKNQKSKRIIQEASNHLFLYFVTLTYSDSNYKFSDEACKRDLQLFLKRLRKRLKDEKIRYYAVKEQGSKTKRNHFHLLIFFDNEINDLYNDEVKYSSLISKSWNLGFAYTEKIYCDEEISRIVNYVSNYVLKKMDNTRLIDFYSKGIGLQEDTIDYLETHHKFYKNGKVYNVDRTQRDKLSTTTQEVIKADNRKYYKDLYNNPLDITKQIEKNKLKIKTLQDKVKNKEKI